MDRTGHFINGHVVDVAFHIEVSSNLGGAHRTLLQADLHRAADIVQGNVTMLQRYLYIGFTVVDGHIAAFAGQVERRVAWHEDVHIGLDSVFAGAIGVSVQHHGISGHRDLWLGAVVVLIGVVLALRIHLLVHHDAQGVVVGGRDVQAAVVSYKPKDGTI